MTDQIRKPAEQANRDIDRILGRNRLIWSRDSHAQ